MSDTSATSVTSTAANPGPLKWRAGLSISRNGVDTVEEIDYEQEGFVRRFWIAPAPRPQQGTPLTADDKRSLLAELEKQLDQDPAGNKRGPLKVFVEVLERAVNHYG